MRLSPQESERKGIAFMELPQQNTSKYYRASLGLKDQVLDSLRRDYDSALVQWMRRNGHCLRVGAIEFHLAREFGFCYGVDKAVDLAYEARERFPDRRIVLIHEIIHNPRVNSRLQEMGIEFLKETGGDDMALGELTGKDVVIIPAFGVSTQTLQRLLDIQCTLVDTTCGSVIHVWKRVERFAKEGFTSLIHGKFAHEETVATKSRAIANGGHYLVVRDLEQTAIVCDFIRGRAGREALAPLIAEAASPGFDPEIHLRKIGCANQTTMLSSESLEVARLVRAALVDRYGVAEIEARFRSFDTICSATQQRQDAIHELVAQGLDLMLVIGGYNSSNTANLCEIAARHCPSYHIDDATAILSADEIRHKSHATREIVITRGWLPEGALRIGVTAGASTPNRAVGQTIQRTLALRGLEPPPEVMQYI